MKRQNANEVKQTTEKNVKILSADGMYSLVDKEVCKLLFYTKVPFIDLDEHDHKFISQREELQIEIRLPLNGLQSMIEILIGEIGEILDGKEKERLLSAGKKDQIQSVEVI